MKVVWLYEYISLRRSKWSVGQLCRQLQVSESGYYRITRDFTVDVPNEKWLTDITEVPCSDGKLYVAPVLDCHNGEIVGLAMDDNIRVRLCIQAFENACQACNARAMILYSDRGSQFTSVVFRATLV